MGEQQLPWLMAFGMHLSVHLASAMHELWPAAASAQQFAFQDWNSQAKFFHMLCRVLGAMDALSDAMQASASPTRMDRAAEAFSRVESWRTNWPSAVPGPALAACAGAAPSSLQPTQPAPAYGAAPATPVSVLPGAATAPLFGAQPFGAVATPVAPAAPAQQGQGQQGSGSAGSGGKAAVKKWRLCGNALFEGDDVEEEADVQPLLAPVVVKAARPWECPMAAAAAEAGAAANVPPMSPLLRSPVGKGAAGAAAAHGPQHMRYRMRRLSEGAPQGVSGPVFLGLPMPGQAGGDALQHAATQLTRTAEQAYLRWLQEQVVNHPPNPSRTQARALLRHMMAGQEWLKKRLQAAEEAAGAAEGGAGQSAAAQGCQGCGPGPASAGAVDASELAAVNAQLQGAFAALGNKLYRLMA